MSQFIVTSEEIKRLIVVSMEYAVAKRRDNPNFMALRNIQRIIKKRKIPEGFKHVAKIDEEGMVDFIEIAKLGGEEG